MFSRLFILSVSALALGAAFLPMHAAAQIAEVRVGIAQFDEEILDLDGDRFGRADETSVAISGEILFEEPKFLKWALSPQPYIGGSVNLEGKTSFGGAGLLWRQNVGKKFYGDFALGVVAHTGTRDINFSEEGLNLLRQLDEFDTFADAPMDLRDAFGAELNALNERENSEIEFGSRLLYRLQGAVGYKVNDDWSGEVYLEHLSHAEGFLIGGNEFVNEGVNNIGIRAVRKF